MPAIPYSPSPNSPESRYAQYKRGKESSGQFMKFPPDYSDYKMVLVAREYQIGSTGANFQIGNSTFQHGFVLPLPQMRLIDTYQVGYDDNFSFLSSVVPQGAERLAQLTGMGVNKFKTVLLDSPQLKRHQFTWKLSPRNVAETNTVRTMFNKLKQCAAPGLWGPGLNILYTFPFIFDIYFEPNFREMYGFKPSVLESISVDYSAGNPFPSLYAITGAPESIVITLDFLEIEVWTRQEYIDWETTSDPTDTVRPINENVRNFANGVVNAATSARDTIANIIRRKQGDPTSVPPDSGPTPQ